MCMCCMCCVCVCVHVALWSVQESGFVLEPVGLAGWVSCLAAEPGAVRGLRKWREMGSIPRSLVVTTVWLVMLVT